MTFIFINSKVKNSHNKQVNPYLKKTMRLGVSFLLVFLIGLLLAACSSTSSPPTDNTVENSSDFRLEVNAEQLVVAQGDSGQIAISMQGMENLDDLELYVEDLPEELLDNTSLSAQGQGVLSVEASTEATLGNYDLTLVAIAGDKESRTAFRLEVVLAGQVSSKVSQLSTQATGEIPVISPISNKSVLRNTINPRTLAIDIEVTDPDNNSFRLRVNSKKRAVIANQPWKNCSSPCRVNLTPVPDKTERVRMTVVVRDPDGNRVSHSFRVNVIPRYVRNTNDSGDQSLRHRIEQATPGDVIGFKLGVNVSDVYKIKLTQPLEINKGLTIEGIGSDKLTIDANSAPQAFFICCTFNNTKDATVFLSDMKITDASSHAIENWGSALTLKSIIITDSGSSISILGGGIFNDSGSLTIYDSRIGGLNVWEANKATKGGGIYSTGPTKLYNTSVIGNHSETQGGGIYGNSIQVLSGSAVSDNQAKGQGGGIFSASGDVVLKNCVLANNSLTYSSDSETSGGGIYSKGDLVIRNCQVTGNTVEGFEYYTKGGGIASLGSLFIKDSTIKNNSLESSRKCNPFVCPGDLEFPVFYFYGAGIYNEGNAILSSDAHVNNNKIYLGPSSGEDPNPISLGGGIYNAGTLTLRSGSQVFLNIDTHTQDGGGIYNMGTLTLKAGSRVVDNGCQNNGCGRQLSYLLW